MSESSRHRRSESATTTRGWSLDAAHRPTHCGPVPDAQNDLERYRSAGTRSATEYQLSDGSLTSAIEPHCINIGAQRTVGRTAEDSTYHFSLLAPTLQGQDIPYDRSILSSRAMHDSDLQVCQSLRAQLPYYLERADPNSLGSSIGPGGSGLKAFADTVNASAAFAITEGRSYAYLTVFPDRSSQAMMAPATHNMEPAAIASPSIFSNRDHVRPG